MGTYREKSNAFWQVMQNTANVFAQDNNPQRDKMAKRMNELSAKRDAEGSLSFQDAEELRQLEYKSGILDTSTDVNLRNKALAPISLKEDWKDKADYLFKQKKELLRLQPKKREKIDDTVAKKDYDAYRAAEKEANISCATGDDGEPIDKKACTSAIAHYQAAANTYKNRLTVGTPDYEAMREQVKAFDIKFKNKQTKDYEKEQKKSKHSWFGRQITGNEYDEDKFNRPNQIKGLNDGILDRAIKTQKISSDGYIDMPGGERLMLNDKRRAYLSKQKTAADEMDLAKIKEIEMQDAEERAYEPLDVSFQPKEKE